MTLSDYIVSRKKNKNILLMTHQILGYPDFDTNKRVVEIFSENDIDLIELQIPFSDPVADGPMFLKANQESLKRGTTLEKCFDFVKEITNKYNIPAIIMTYYNILYQKGIESFIKTCSDIGVKGLIVPDAVPEESAEYYENCRKYGVDSILLATPYTPVDRMKYLADQGSGFMYCVPRKGVTGYKTNFDKDTIAFINKCKSECNMPIGVGFGIQEREDIDLLIGNADIAIIGSKLMAIIEKSGVEGIKEFLSSLK